MASYEHPGVYVEEVSTLPPSVAGVSTAIPAFIGYTESGYDTNTGPVPKRITSLMEYNTSFGGAKAVTFTVTTDNNNNITGVAAGTLKHTMYHNLEMYFNNGGGPCYIVSVGTHADTHTKAAFQAGITALESEDEPTLILITEAVSLSETDYYAVCQDALAHCGKMKDRFAIIDVLDSDTVDAANFRNGVASNFLQYGAAYYPYLKTTLNHHYLETEVTVGGQNEKLDTLKSTKTRLYNKVKAALSQEYLSLPPSAAMAGIYATVDRERGVWKAPANIPVSSVTGPVKDLTNEQQAKLNIHAQGGKSVNAIRSFMGRGTLVWGARTLAGNDNEWRYISVRRLFNMIEESTQKASNFAVFEPNVATTWLKVRAMIESYLYDLWQNGAMAGSTPEASYFVNVGLGKSMTEQDILEGKMIVEIGIAAVRPAEFIILRFSHKLQEA